MLGEVVTLLDIAKCLYDAIARIKRLTENGKAITCRVLVVPLENGTNASRRQHGP